jgi:hypothetical protein
MTGEAGLWARFFYLGAVNAALDEVALTRIALRQASGLMRMILDVRPTGTNRAAKLRLSEILGTFPST